MNEPTYYKAVRPDGTDFHSGRIDYAAALASGDTITHPVGNINSHTVADYLSVSVSSTDCTGAQWPCRLFRVEPIGPVGVPGVYPSKRSVAALRVVEELPAVEALGPQGQAIVALIERARALTLQEVSDLDVAGDAAWDAAGDAAGAVVVRDLIGTTFTQEQYDLLTGHWRKVVGPVHPDDADIR